MTHANSTHQKILYRIPWKPLTWLVLANAWNFEPCSQLFWNNFWFMLTNSFLPSPLIHTQYLQVCLSNVIQWSGIPLIVALLSDNIIYTLHCHAVTLIHWLSSFICWRVCSFTFHCALLQHMCTRLLHSPPITGLCWNAFVPFISHIPNVSLIWEFQLCIRCIPKH